MTRALLLVCLLVATSVSSSPDGLHGVSVSVFNNTVVRGTTVKPPSIAPTLNVALLDDGVGSLPAWSAEVNGQLSYPEDGSYAFICPGIDTVGFSQAFVWIGDHLVCQTGAYSNPPSSTDGLLVNPIRATTDRGPVVVRMHLFFNGTETRITTASERFAVQIRWCMVESDKCKSGSWQDIPSSLLSPTLPSLELQRRSLQTSLAQGWNSWLHFNLLTLMLLPESVTLTWVLCQRSTGACLNETSIQGPAAVRVGPHAFDNSYAQYYVAHGSVNVSVEFSGSLSNDSVVAVVTPVGDCGGNCSDYTLTAWPAIAWQRAGTVSASTQDRVLTLAPYNLRQQQLYFVSESLVDEGLSDSVQLTFSLTAPVAVASGKRMSLADVQRVIAAAREAELQRYAKYGHLSEVKFAVQSAVTWTFIYTPVEFGPFSPVSRAWDFTSGHVTKDWSYVIFDWDNIFASYIMGFDARDHAYSNLIQVIKSKTGDGFVPNYSAGGKKSVDRTEPPIGAKVLLELYHKYKDKWIVEYLFGDLLDWNDWFLRRRVLDPLGLICLGSDYIPRYWDPSSDHMQGARYESGLDNSPMYDGSFFDNTTHQMQLYDVGMTSMFTMEAYALAELATIIGQSATASMLTLRAESMAKLLKLNLWDSARGVYANKFVNGTFYPRISPTSFYSMLTGAPSEAEADQMMKAWMFNTSRFCVNAAWPKLNSDTCYWGLPSISADDPAFPPLGYWRGYVWGPMAQLTYWSLQKYEQVASVATAKRALSNQMTQMMLNQWHRHRHICENFNPHKNGTECTGSRFYHWGALTGLITLIQNGLY